MAGIENCRFDALLQGDFGRSGRQCARVQTRVKRGGARKSAREFLQNSASAGVLAFVLLASALLPAAVRAQASQTAPPDPSPPSAESLPADAAGARGAEG